MVLVAAVGISALFAGCMAPREIASRTVGWIPWVHSNTARPPSGPVAEKTVKAGALKLSLRLDPFPLRLSDTRRMEAKIRLENSSPRFIRLDFPTTQRFDALVRDGAGNVVAQWSEDQAFEALAGFVSINPGEHVEYRAVLSTRDLQPGGHYSLAVFFPSRNEVKVELPFVPEP